MDVPVELAHIICSKYPERVWGPPCYSLKWVVSPSGPDVKGLVPKSGPIKKRCGSVGNGSSREALRSLRILEGAVGLSCQHLHPCLCSCLDHVLLLLPQSTAATLKLPEW